MDALEVGWDEDEGMYYCFCTECGSEVFSNAEDDAQAAGLFHLENGHVWEYDMEEVGE